MGTYGDKLRSLQFPRVKTVKVKDRATGRVLGEQHYHDNGSVGATVFAEKGDSHVVSQTPG